MDQLATDCKCGSWTISLCMELSISLLESLGAIRYVKLICMEKNVYHDVSAIVSLQNWETR